MLDVLKDEFSEIICTSPTGMLDTRIGNIFYKGYCWPFSAKPTISKLQNLFNRVLDIITLGKSKEEEGWLWLHSIYAMDPVFAKHVDEITDWADAVIVEFTFPSLPILKACRHKNKRVIITLHDILSDHVTKSKLLKYFTRKIEINAMKKADCIVCTSISDRERLKKYGINAEIIPHGIDIQRYNTEPQKHSEVISDVLGDFGLPQQNICLFVGAWHLPNFEAVDTIRQLAKSMQSTGKDKVNFVVVGDCCKAERNDNFFALGKVDEEVLHALYNAAAMVLIPLTKGAGASLKTIEAMAYGKVILGTTVAFRGYSVESNVNCLISDEFSGYKKLIIDLLADQNKRKEIGSNARKFAELFDSRLLYRRYVDLIMERGCDK